MKRLKLLGRLKEGKGLEKETSGKGLTPFQLRLFNDSSIMRTASVNGEQSTHTKEQCLQYRGIDQLLGL